MNARLALAAPLLAALPAFGAAQEGERVALDAPPAETFDLELRYEAAASIYEGTPAPRITLEVGVAPEGDPVSYLAAPVLGRVETGDDGRGVLTLAVPVRWKDDALARVFVRIETAGFQRWTWAYPLEEAQEGRSRSLVVKRGGTQFGSVRTPSGAPVPNARVWFLRGSGGKYTGAVTNEAGHFWAHFGTSGNYRVHVRAAAPGAAPGGPSGSADGGPVVLDAMSRLEAIELELQPGPRVAGRIVDPDGAPLSGVEILAIPSGHTRFPDAHTCAAAEKGALLLGGVARADAAGQFSLPGLVAGAYDFYASVETRWLPQGTIARTRSTTAPIGSPPRPKDGFLVESVDPDRFVGTVQVDSTTTSIELIHALQRLAVTVRDERGEPVSPIFHDEDGNLEGSYLEVRGIGPDAWRDDVYRARIVGDLALFPLQPDRDYAVSWEDPGRPRIERLIRTRMGAPWLTALDLRLEPAGSPARLEVLVLDPEGEPWGPESWEQPRVVIRSPETGRQLTGSVSANGNSVRGSRWSVELPPGEFIVEGNAQPWFGCEISHPLERAEFTPARAGVELAAGEERQLTLRLGPAGHLDLESLAGAAGPGPDEQHLFQDEHGTYICGGDFARSAFGGGVATLTRAGHAPIERMAFEIPGAPCTETDWIRPGWSARCLTPIPPGTWTLRVEDGGRVLFQRDVLIEAGRATGLRW